MPHYQHQEEEEEPGSDLPKLAKLITIEMSKALIHLGNHVTVRNRMVVDYADDEKINQFLKKIYPTDRELWYTRGGSGGKLKRSHTKSKKARKSNKRKRKSNRKRN